MYCLRRSYPFYALDSFPLGHESWHSHLYVLCVISVIGYMRRWASNFSELLSSVDLLSVVDYILYSEKTIDQSDT
eukprot:snap_masked-scaffold_4-processed-gene-21.24-mRNA-1 protein AED:1.00 eAED:1.00 QI:0/0/0/0/1/1/2/0/74